jgi:predicted XRE-type DNA-binding protein
MNRQIEIRQKLNEYITSNGVKAKYIAELLDICPSLISRFRNSKVEMRIHKLEVVEEFLSNF